MPIAIIVDRWATLVPAESRLLLKVASWITWAWTLMLQSRSARQTQSSIGWMITLIKLFQVVDFQKFRESCHGHHDVKYSMSDVEWPNRWISCIVNCVTIWSSALVNWQCDWVAEMIHLKAPCCLCLQLVENPSLSINKSHWHPQKQETHYSW